MRFVVLKFGSRNLALLVGDWVTLPISRLLASSRIVFVGRIQLFGACHWVSMRLAPNGRDSCASFLFADDVLF